MITAGTVVSLFMELLVPRLSMDYRLDLNLIQQK